jgi:hypothetical protein
VAAEAIERYGFVSLGRTAECQTQLFLITAERRIEHPAVALLAREAGRTLIGRRRKAKSPAAASSSRAGHKVRVEPRTSTAMATKP